MEIKNKRSERFKKSPFRLSFMRWYEIFSIILLSVFANTITNLTFNIKGSVQLFLSVGFLFCSALLLFNIYRLMGESWLDATMREHNDPIKEFYKSFSKWEEIQLWISFFCAIGAFIAYSGLK